MSLRRRLQLLNVRRTIRLERDMERLVASSVNLAGSTERLVRALGGPASNATDALGAATRGSMFSSLVAIQHLMDCGRVKDAKLMLDALVMVSKAEGANAKSAS